MFDELNKYKNKDHFFFKPGDKLAEVCNAPTDKSGVYLIYALAHGRIELVYIGRSGEKNEDGSIKTRVAGLGGIKDRIVNGHHFGKIPRKKSWPTQMLIERIEALDVYWWITHNNTYKDCPRELENILLDKYCQIHGGPPRWNKVK